MGIAYEKNFRYLKCRRETGSKERKRKKTTQSPPTQPKSDKNITVAKVVVYELT